MKNCQSCRSNRLVKFQLKNREFDIIEIKGKNYIEISENEYMPADIGLTPDNDEYWTGLEYCMNCGRIQGNFPLPISETEKMIDKKG